MKAKKIKFENFRNLTAAEVTFSPGVNVLWGQNAQGKSNILEGIYYFSRGKSFRGVPDKLLVKHEEPFGSVQLTCRADGDQYDTVLEAVIPRQGRKRLTRGGAPLSGVKELVGSFRAVLFCPEHLSLVSGSPAERRNFLDVALAQLSPRYVSSLTSYTKILTERNALLKQAAEESSAPISMCGMLEAVTLPEDFMRNREVHFETLTMDEDTLVSLHDADKYPAWVACAKLIRRDLIESYPFREGRVYEDNEAVCHWLCKGGSLARSREMLYFYRGNPESTTKSEFRLKRLDYLWALESLIDFYTGLGYEGMRQRFVARYIDAVSNCCNGARYMLQRPDVVKQIEDSTRAFLRRQKITLNQEQFELLLDVMHPNWMKLYWPVSAVTRTIRQNGVSGLLKKLCKKMGKGDGQ